MSEQPEKISHANRQTVLYCPYCAEETLFPLEGGGWECRSCFRAFSVAFLGLVSRDRSAQEHAVKSAGREHAR
jgi:hypothetical protein